MASKSTLHKKQTYIYIYIYIYPIALRASRHRAWIEGTGQQQRQQEEQQERQENEEQQEQQQQQQQHPLIECSLFVFSCFWI